MSELFCQTFLTAFLFFYAALTLGLVGWGIRGVIESRRKRIRALNPPERVRKLALSLQTQRN